MDKVVQSFNQIENRIIRYMFLKYIKKDNSDNEDDEVKQAGACFIKALQIYRLLGDESGKCAGALYNLEDARDWHREWKKIQPVKQCTSTLSSSFLLDETFDLIEVSYCLMPC